MAHDQRSSSTSGANAASVSARVSISTSSIVAVAWRQCAAPVIASWKRRRCQASTGAAQARLRLGRLWRSAVKGRVGIAAQLRYQSSCCPVPTTVTISLSLPTQVTR